MNNQNSAVHATATYQGLVEGDPKIITTFYYRVRKRIYLHFKLRSTDFQMQQLDDCINRGFLKFLEKIRSESFKTVNLEGYAFTIIKGYFKNQTRNRKTLISFAPETLPEVEPTTAKCYSAEDFFDTHTSERLKHWFQTLSQRDQQIFDLQLKGYKQKESAQLLNLSHGSLRNIYSQLIQEARKIIQN